MIKICENQKCSKEFEAREKSSKYCSRSCSATVNNTKHKKRSLKPAYCKYCEVEIPRESHKHQPSVCQKCKGNRVRKKKKTQQKKLAILVDEKTCAHCSVTKKASEFYSISKRNKNVLYSYCKDCARVRQREKSVEVKQQCVDYLGGKCEMCGYNKCLKALEFHHKDPTQKDFQISARRLAVFGDKLKNELDKCMLLCANCHREVHETIEESD
jgi:hypothetical protein